MSPRIILNSKSDVGISNTNPNFCESLKTRGKNYTPKVEGISHRPKMNTVQYIIYQSILQIDPMIISFPISKNPNPRPQALDSDLSASQGGTKETGKEKKRKNKKGLTTLSLSLSLLDFTVPVFVGHWDRFQTAYFLGLGFNNLNQ